MIKFLKEGVIKLEGHGVKIEFNQVNSSMQALLIAMAADKTSTGKTALSSLILKQIITKLEIEGVPYKPVDVATKADLSHPPTIDVFYRISSLVIDELMLGFETKKKSKQPDLPIEKEEIAIIAPEAKEDGPATTA